LPDFLLNKTNITRFNVTVINQSNQTYNVCFDYKYGIIPELFWNHASTDNFYD